MNKKSYKTTTLLDKLPCFGYTLSYEFFLLNTNKICGGAKGMKPNKGYNKSVFRSLALISQIGINMLVAICMMSALGLYLDKKLGTSYIMMILFFVGAIAGAQNAYRMAKQVYTNSEKDCINKDTVEKNVERSAARSEFNGKSKK